ncbi:MAG TPA: PspC domain-containing protein [Marmoricola sp.]|nr:PspC domain-containing protein [Marmoricola sp.]
MTEHQLPPQAPQPPEAPQPPQRRLTRSSDDRMLGGVCAGVADYLGVDPTIVRLLTVVLGVIFFPLAEIGYLVAWMVMPDR